VGKEVPTPAAAWWRDRVGTRTFSLAGLQDVETLALCKTVIKLLKSVQGTTVASIQKVGQTKCCHCWTLQCKNELGIYLTCCLNKSPCYTHFVCFALDFIKGATTSNKPTECIIHPTDR